MHHDIVPTCPPQVERLVQSQHCGIPAMYIEHRLISVQGHPEFNGKILHELLDLRHGKALDDKTYYDRKLRADLPHDGLAVAAGFIKFLLAGRHETSASGVAAHF